LDRIIPGYANEATSKLKSGGSQEDGTAAAGELGIV